ncbi:MAG: tyrosine--tRNA ligase, partial [Armatimonadota bacterium]|nr:tyrosine--tRNA ligase [Armatimonadota bacterium]
DPSGRIETRPQLSPEQVKENAKTYFDQYTRILDPSRTRVVFNSQWLSPLTFQEIIGLASKVTVARILERDDFAERMRQGLPLHLHEILYPLCQAYDSVALEADVEMGGTDQKFNNLMGRDLQREFGQEPQVVFLMPILVGLDGQQKMSKSLGNYIGIAEPPEEMFGKVMSLPDDLMVQYFVLCTDVPMEEVQAIDQGLKEGTLHPRDIKRRLAREIVTIYHGKAAATAAEEAFDRVFVAKELPEQVPEVFLEADDLEGGRIWIVKLLVLAGLVESNSEAKRLISQGGVSVDGRRITDIDTDLVVTDGMVVRVGKRRFARIRLT